MGRFYRASVCGVDVIITVIASVVQTLAQSDYSKRIKTFGDVYSSNTWSRKNCFLWHFIMQIIVVLVYISARVNPVLS